MKNQKEEKNMNRNDEKTLKEEVMKNINMSERIDRREVEEKNKENNLNKDRRSGSDRRNNNLIGGRRKTDLSEAEAKEFEKILSSGDSEKALRRLEDRNYRNLNDEAKKIEIKKTIGEYKLNTKRLITLVTLVFIAASLISITLFFVNRKTKLKQKNQNQVTQIKQELNKTLQNKVDNAALENIENKFK